MLVARFHEQNGLGSLLLEEVERPEPGENEALVKIRAASVNAIDARVLRGEFHLPELPATLGGDFAGEVVEVGPRVDTLEPGDRVYGTAMSLETWGTFAEYAPVPVDRLGLLPETLSFEDAAAGVTAGSTAYDSLIELADLTVGETCLIHGGSGGIGHVAVQLAAASGAFVISTAGTDAAREMVRSLGADVVLDYRAASLGEKISASSPNGVDVILDHRLDEYLELDLDVAADGGTIITIQGDIPQVSAAALRNKKVRIQGRSGEQWLHRRSFLETTLAPLMDRHAFEPRIQATYPLSDVVEAERTLLEDQVIGKLVLIP